MATTGGCLCRAVRYSIGVPALQTRSCWCRVCQYIGAGSATVNACFPNAALSVSGELRDYAMVADSGAVAHRRFCPTCGTHLFSASEARPELVFVRVGTLDDPEGVRPDTIVWTASAPSWACFDAGLPRVDRQAPPVA